MKKTLLLFISILFAASVSAQQAKLIYKASATVSNDASWNDDEYDYTYDFAFRGTPVTVEVYDDNSVIIRKWAGSDTVDLKIAFDPSIDTDDEDCLGNIVAVNPIINGVEQKPYTYEVEVEATDDYDAYTYTACDVPTGRADWSIADMSYNEDGTIYWSFAYVDDETKTGSVQLTAYFSNDDYTEFADAQYYYVEWQKSADGINAATGQKVGTSYKGILIQNGKKVWKK